VAFIRGSTPSRIVKGADGRLTVTWVHAESGAEASGVFDTVFTATGRVADTGALNLAAAGVAAVFLVAHCGLNPMGGRARAGCPWRNIQARS
jgi:hypothetical protein